MGKFGGIIIGSAITLLGVLWFYFVLYSWLWCGLVDAESIGWGIGFGTLFILFLFLSIPVTIGLGMGYVFAVMLADE